MGQIKVTKCPIEGLYIIEPQVFGDARGYFMETYSLRDMQNAGLNMVFVQDNQSRSREGVVRGLHYQVAPFAQTKLVRVVRGEILDVAVDLRRGSPTLLRHVAVRLSEDNHRQLLIPRGFAHGFVALSEEAVLQYKCSAYYLPEAEGGVAWNDPTLAIAWPIAPDEVCLSPKDQQHPLLADAKCF